MEVVAAPGEDRAIGQVAERAADVKFYLLSNAATPHRRRRRRSRRGLLFVDCQLGVRMGKMKGSTKPERMDEPFSFKPDDRSHQGCVLDELERVKQKAATRLNVTANCKCGLSAFRSSNDYPQPFVEQGGSSRLARSLSAPSQ